MHAIRDPRQPRATPGFTLIELMVVIAIIGMLGTIVATSVLRNHDDAQLATARSTVLRMQDIVVQYRLENRKLPGSLAALVTPDERGRVWITGYSTTPKDPWGNEYALIERDGDPPFEVVSYGPDGQPDTEDDISSRNARDS